MSNRPSSGSSFASPGDRLNSSDSRMEIRTPAQERLRRLQTRLRIEQEPEAPPQVIKVDENRGADQRDEQRKAIKRRAQDSYEPQNDVIMKDDNMGAGKKEDQRKAVKRRAQDSYQPQEDAIKKAKIDVTDKSKLLEQRKMIARRARPKIPNGISTVDNDIEMTEAVVQGEVMVHVTYSYSVSNHNTFVLSDRCPETLPAYACVRLFP